MPTTPAFLRLCAGVPAFFLMTSSYGQVLQWGAEEEVGPGGLDFLRPRIHLSSDGRPVVVWGNDGLHAVHGAFSVGAGSWVDADVSVLVQGHPYLSDWTGVQTASDGVDAWAVYGTGTNANGPIYLHRFANGFPSISDTLRIDTPIGEEYKLPSVTPLPNGEAAILVMRTATGWLDAEYILIRTTVNGTAVLPPVLVSAPVAPGEVCDCCTGEVMSSGNTIVALFRNNNGNQRSIWAAVSTDGGDTFSAATEVDPTAWTINACPSSGPDAFIAGDSLRVVFMSGAVNGTKSYGRSLHLQTLGLGPLMDLWPGQLMSQSQNLPRIAGDADTLGVVWQQGQAGQFEILFRWSVNGWAGLSAPDTVHVSTTGAQKNPDITFGNGAFHIVWQDAPSGNVHYRKATLPADVAVNDHPGRPGLTVWPVPATDNLFVDAPTGDNFIVQDASGRIVMSGVFTGGPIDVSAMRNGVFSLSFNGAGSRPLGRRMFVIAR
jgi:hypothetical protein